MEQKSIDEMFDYARVILSKEQNLSLENLDSKSFLMRAGQDNIIRITKNTSISTEYSLNMYCGDKIFSRSYIDFKTGSSHGDVRVKELYDDFHKLYSENNYE